MSNPTPHTKKEGWSQEDVAFLIENYGKMLQKDIAAHLNKNVASIYNRSSILRNSGKIFIKDFVPWPITKHGKDFIDKLTEKYKEYGVAVCSKEFNIREKEIFNIVSAMGVKRSKKPIPKTNYRFDTSVLSKPTKEFAYFLGYMWGDGHIHKTRSMIGFDCAFDDLSSLYSYFYIFSSWYSEKRQRQPSRKNGKIPKPILTLRHYNRDLYDYLASNNYASKSGGSANCILDKLPANLRSFWWRGYFDADGHISFSKSKQFQKTGGALSICSCFDQEWDFAIKLMTDLNIEKYEIEKSTCLKNGSKSVLVIRDTLESVKFLDYIYLDFPQMGLGRKFYVYTQIKEYLEYKIKNPHLFTRKGLK